MVFGVEIRVRRQGKTEGGAMVKAQFQQTSKQVDELTRVFRQKDRRRKKTEGQKNRRFLRGEEEKGGERTHYSIKIVIFADTIYNAIN